MVYYLTPTELMAKVEADPSFRSVGVKVSGRVIPGTYRQGEGEIVHLFQVQDIENEEVSFAVRFEDVLPDTSPTPPRWSLKVVSAPTVSSQAETLLTKCGSRYEASPEELKGGEIA